MMAVASALLHAAAIPGTKTYADFAAWAATQGTTVGVLASFGAFRGLARLSLPAAFSGNLYGSPWGQSPADGIFSTDSLTNRVALHAFLSLSEANANKGREVLMLVDYAGDYAFSGISRNGYDSLSYGTPEAALYCTRFDYFDDASGKIRRVNPLTMTYVDVDLP